LRFILCSYLGQLRSLSQVKPVNVLRKSLPARKDWLIAEDMLSQDHKDVAPTTAFKVSQVFGICLSFGNSLQTIAACRIDLNKILCLKYAINFKTLGDVQIRK